MPEGSVNVRLEVSMEILGLQFRHTCIFPSALGSEDEDCLNKSSPVHVLSVYVEETHTLSAVSLVLMRRIIKFILQNCCTTVQHENITTSICLMVQL